MSSLMSVLLHLQIFVAAKKMGSSFVVANLVNAVIAKAGTVVFTKCTAAANLFAELCTLALCTATTIFCCCSS